MSERNNVLILLAIFMIIGMAATTMQIFQGSDVNEITISLNNTGNLDTPIQSITYESQSRGDIKLMLDTHIISGYSDPRYLVSGDYFASAQKMILSHSGVLSDYQIKLTIPHESTMQVDFDDIRFTTFTGTHIPHWIESKTDSITADVWIKNDYLDGDTDIWWYYGNAGLSSESDIHNRSAGLGDDFNEYH